MLQVLFVAMSNRSVPTMREGRFIQTIGAAWNRIQACFSKGNQSRVRGCENIADRANRERRQQASESKRAVIVVAKFIHRTPSRHTTKSASRRIPTALKGYDDHCFQISTQTCALSRT